MVTPMGLGGKKNFNHLFVFIVGHVAVLSLSVLFSLIAWPKNLLINSLFLPKRKIFLFSLLMVCIGHVVGLAIKI